MDTAFLARHGILDMSPYVPGKPVEEVQREYGFTDVVKMASNENPLHTSPLAMIAMERELKNCFMYPEGSSPGVREALSRHLEIDSNCILVGNGGDHVINMICAAFVNEGDEVIVGDPSFKTYESSTAIAGGVLVRVPLIDNTTDLGGMLAAVTEKTKLIFVCNPNNPTGTIVTIPSLDTFIKHVPAHCIVVLDEAYFEYAQSPDYKDGIDYVKQGKNVIVIRTFSKIFGLAGLRIGYAVLNLALMEILARVLPPFPVNRIAQAGAIAALEDTKFLNEVIRVNAEGREYLYASFDALGMDCAHSYANYVFVDTHMPADALSIALLRRGIIIRPATQWGFSTSLRVTVGTMAENERFIAALTDLQSSFLSGGTL
ncbi:MAG: histidinol-phosphate transaminase [Clostridia bacterium]